jgi:hypothetical protein
MPNSGASLRSRRVRTLLRAGANSFSWIENSRTGGDFRLNEGVATPAWYRVVLPNPYV